MAEKMSEARRALLDAARSFARAKRTMEARRDELHVAVVAAVRSGESKSQVARDTGYTREYVTDLVKSVDRREAEAAVAQSVTE